MDDVKKGYRETEETAKETWRKADGDESLADKVGEPRRRRPQGAGQRRRRARQRDGSSDPGRDRHASLIGFDRTPNEALGPAAGGFLLSRPLWDPCPVTSLQAAGPSVHRR